MSQRLQAYRRMPHRWPMSAQYTLAVAVIAVVLWLRWLAGGYLGDRLVFAFVLGALLPLVMLVRAGPFLAATLLAWIGSVLLLAVAGTGVAGGPDGPVWLATLVFAMPVAAAWLARRSVDAEERARRRAKERERALMEEALDAKAKFQSVFNQSGIFAGITDLDGIVREANDRCLSSCGYRAEEVIGRPFWQTPWWRGSAQVQEEIRRATEQAASGAAYESRLPYWTADGTERVVDFAMHPIRDEAGKMTFLHPTGIDITEQVQARRDIEKSEERLRIATAAAEIGLHDFNVPSGTVEWDERTRQFFGVDADEPITYALWRDCVFAEDRVAAESAVSRALDPAGDGQYLAQYRVTSRHDGTVRWIEATGRTTFRDGRPVRLVGTTQDITERKRTEQVLRDADRRKDEFLATLAHELRNPLAAIRAALDVLEGGDDEALAEEMKRIIERQSSQLVRLIDDLMDVSRISRGTIKLERRMIDAAALTRQVVNDSRDARHGRRLDVETSIPDVPVLVDADPTRLGQVIHNLLNNACKFTPDGGHILVELAADGPQAVLRVKDTGIGLTAEHRARIFDMFVQIAGPEWQQARGLGIGLPLAKSIIELHGGTIEALSDGPERGTQVVVRLPALSGHGMASHGSVDPAQLEADPTVGAKCKVVAADDNLDALLAVSCILRRQGHEIITATQGVDAWTAVQRHRPQVALLDIGMPGMDGYEIARRIRLEAWGAGMLLVAMTGWGQERDKQRALAAGFDVHLTKPVDAALLARAVAGREGRPGIATGSDGTDAQQ